MQFAEETIRLVADRVTLITLDAPLEDRAPSPVYESGSGLVQIKIPLDSPRWRGALTLESSQTFAKKAAGKLFGKEVSEITISDMKDAMGELANMISGGLKLELPEPITLGIPEMASLDHPDHIGGNLISRQVFSCWGDPFVIALYDKGGWQ